MKVSGHVLNDTIRRHHDKCCCKHGQSSRKDGSSLKTKKAKTPINDTKRSQLLSALLKSETFATLMTMRSFHFKLHPAGEFLKRRSTSKAMVPENKPKNVIFQPEITLIKLIQQIRVESISVG
jgi:hypothetical protein